MNAVALDPGITTGYATGIIDDETSVMSVLTGEDKWTHIDLWDFLMNAKPLFIISERFEFRHGFSAKYKGGQHGLEMFSRELIGVCYLYSQMYPQCEVKLQPAMKGTGGNYFSDDRLRTLGLFKSGKGHANDAARHLLYWARFKSGSQFVKSYKSGAML